MVHGPEEGCNYCVAARIGAIMEELLQYERYVKEASRSVARNWGKVDEEDLSQELWLILVKSPGTREYLGAQSGQSVRRLVFRMARQIASEEHTKYQIARWDFRYGVKEVRRLLEEGILKGQEDSITSSNWGQTAVRKTGIADSTCLTASAFSDIVEGMIELRKRPSSRYFDLIVRKYVLHDKIERGADSNATSRALKSLTTIMNRKRKRDQAAHVGPGSKEAVSNRSAQAKNSRNYEGENFGSQRKAPGLPGEGFFL